MEYEEDYTFNISEEAATKRYLVRIISLDRKEEKTFCTLPHLKDTIVKANQYGCNGDKLLLACDGCEVCDNESYLYYITKGTKFMVASSATEWKSPEVTDSSIDTPEVQSIVFDQSIAVQSNASPRDHTLYEKPKTEPQPPQPQQPQKSKQPKQQQQTAQPKPKPKPQQQLLQQEQDRSPSPRRRTTRQGTRLRGGSDQPRPHLKSKHSSITSLPPKHAVLVTPEDHFKDIDIPWNRIPSELGTLLLTGEPLDKHIEQLIHLVVHELRMINKSLPIRVLRMVADRLVSRYTKSFQMTVMYANRDPVVIVLNLAMAMKDHNNDLNLLERTAVGDHSAMMQTCGGCGCDITNNGSGDNNLDEQVSVDGSSTTVLASAARHGPTVWPNVFLPEYD